MNNFDVLFAKSLTKGGGGTGTDNYNELSNKPQINGNALTGNKTGANLGLQDAITSESKISSDLIDDTGAENLFVSATDKSTWGGKQDPATTLSGYGITDAYTKTEIDTALSGKQNALSQSQLAAANSGITAAKLTADETALGEVINGGAAGTKNLSTVSEGSTSSAAGGFPIASTPIKISEGTYIISFNFTGAATRGSVNFRRGSTAVYSKSFDMSASVSEEIQIGANAVDNFNVYSNGTSGITNLMICRKTLYNVNPDYEPYAPAKTNVEITPALVEVVDNGAKNLLNCSLTEIKSDSYNSGGAYQFTWNGNVCTTPRGVTFTINSDNSIDVVATSVTSDVWFRLKQNFQYDVDSYVISGCPSGGSTTTYFIESDNLNARDTGNSIVINRSSTYTDNIFLVVKSGMTFTGTFKPMICSKSQWDVSHQFEPYAKTNPELTAKLTADEAALAEVVDAGAKNYAKESETIETTSTWLGQIPVSPLQGECVFSAATTWESGLCDLYGYEQGGTRTHLGTVTVSNYKIIKKYTTDKDFIYVQIYYNNATAKKLTNVMICTAADWEISQKFVPYCPSMAEMYEMILALQNGTRSAPALAKAEPEESRTEPEEVEPETGEEETR